MLRLRKLLIKNPNKITIAHLNVNSTGNKFEMLFIIISRVIDMLMIFETKIVDSFTTEQFVIEGFSTIYS